jgi:hypothetical protein
LSERVDDDPLVNKLLSLDGVGLITAVMIHAEIGRFDRFRNGKQLSRFGGLTPRNVVVEAVANRWIRWLFHAAQRPLAPTGAHAAIETNMTTELKTAPVDLCSGSTTRARGRRCGGSSCYGR